MPVSEKHPHYHKNVAHLETIDVYRVLERFNVTDSAIQHAVKKLLVSGRRGAGKDQLQDVIEAIHSLQRFEEMYHENAQEELPKDAFLPLATEGLNREEVSQAIQQFLSGKPDRRTMPQKVREELTARKARKRTAKAPARRGR